VRRRSTESAVDVNNPNVLVLKIAVRNTSGSDSPVPPKAQSVGLFCGKYNIVARLGRGGMANVHLAVSRGPGGFNKLVVLKRLATDDDTAKRLFLDEARLAALLQHPNVVDTYEIAEESASYYIAMEFLDGQPLDCIIADLRLHRCEFEPAVCARIVADALAGLHYMHEVCDYSGQPLNVVHRDVSPHNVFLTFDGTVKILDFGIAKSNARSDETAVGIVRGKLAYMAPEQAAGEEVDLRADVYAAGLMLWELLTLRRLRQGSSQAEIMAEALNGSVPRLALARLGLGPSLSAIVSKALARDPKERFQTALEMREALLEYLADHPCSTEALAAMMEQRFRGARAAMQRQIGECLRKAEQSEELVSIEALAAASDGSKATPGMAADMPLLEGTHSAGPDAITRNVRTGSVAVSIRADGASERVPAVTPPRRPPAWSWAVLFGLTGALAAAFALRQGPAPPAMPRTAAASVVQTMLATPEIVLRIHGSNTIGDELAPRLVEAFLRKRGLEGVTRRRSEDRESVLVSGKLTASDRAEAIELQALGSATAFEDLAAHRCDIGMASRRIKPEEARLIEDAGLGDLRSPAGEHVLALDGIAIITHPNNALTHLDISTLGKIFTGEIDDFAAVGGTPGKVHPYARDDNSGTYDLFKHLVLGDLAVSVSAERITNSNELSRRVSVDPQGIGFIGVAYVHGAKPLAISDGSARSFYPTPFTVATEGYPLSRRLHLYLPVRNVRPLAVDFVNFALSPEGQELVRASGFIDLTPRATDAEPCEPLCPERYAALIKGAKRVSVDFRFHGASAQLDSRAQRDVDRVVSFLSERRNARVLLLAFSDARGRPNESLALARERAQVVATEFASRGVQVASIEAVGPELPAASNDSEDGRDRNRRVELWLR